MMQTDRAREAELIWSRYKAAETRGDLDSYFELWQQAGRWVQQHYPAATGYSLDVIIDHRSGITVLYPAELRHTMTPYGVQEGDGFRELVWQPADDDQRHPDCYCDLAEDPAATYINGVCLYCAPDED